MPKNRKTFSLFTPAVILLSVVCYFVFVSYSNSVSSTGGKDGVQLIEGKFLYERFGLHKPWVTPILNHESIPIETTENVDADWFLVVLHASQNRNALKQFEAALEEDDSTDIHYLDCYLPVLGESRYAYRGLFRLETYQLHHVPYGKVLTEKTVVFSTESPAEMTASINSLLEPGN